jgi:outer membrane protein OmpA-like peptidoglycan-associated protein
MRPTNRALLVIGLALGLAAAQPSVATAEGPPPAKLVVRIDKSKVDLPNHKLEVRLSRAAAKIVLKVFGDSGASLAEVEKSFDGAPAGTPIEMTWTPSSDEAVAKVEVWGYDTKGYWAAVAIVPWTAKVAHEEVNFATDSDAIRGEDVPKLQASLAKITEVVEKHASLGRITLFVLGHTDTVGPAEHNFALSRRRARAIARWFREHGLPGSVGVAFEGAGESMLLVKTEDDVAEQRNRRVDYILALEPPALPADLSWKAP